ncbi:MAG: UDP-N-acetylmuramoyl-tripeptide--D-alanyl-D-alanine ligase [Ignavibacteriales bacterium]|nr:UDP-N-acetylmuramoyl-tripeptide--D-alanyl-D-alanine ligase [Ignavibacteriales bacterium]
MKKITIKDLQKLTGAQIINKDLLKRRRITGVSTDSRAVKNGDLFFALKGEKFDAHDFIDDVVRNAAAAIVVHHEWAVKHDLYFRTFPCAFIIVPDTTIAFGELARLYRRKFDIPIVAIGGSNGKTTTKEMITAMMKTKYAVLHTEGNLNNHIGLPQTLFRLTNQHDVAVIELGTNHFGELKYLCEIAEPTHGLITNIGKEHLEFFGDENGVAKEEKELFRYLEANDGFAFVNGDDKHLQDERRGIKKSMSYGTTSKSDIRGKKIEMNELGQSHFTVEWHKKDLSFTVKLSVPGMHNVTNALAASAVGLKLKVKPKKIADALRKFSPASKRMEVLSHNGVIILNDTYNSNPDSVIVALKTLKSFTTSGKKIVVLGDMKELGDASKREHTNIGVIASEMKFDALFTFGPFSKYTCEAFGHSSAKHFESKDELSSELKRILQHGDVVLIKGSRGMKMEEVVQQLTASNGQLKEKH